MMMQMVVALIVGVSVALIAGLRGYTKFKKILNQCSCDPDETDTFRYKGKLYSKEKYLQLRVAQFSKMKQKDLMAMLKDAEEKLPQSKEQELEQMEIEAYKAALRLAAR